jgi:hypothetical protein
MSRSTLSSRLSFCRPTIMLFRPGGAKPCLLLSYSGHWYQSRLQCFTFSAPFYQKRAVGKMLRQQKTVTSFPSLVFFKTLSHTSELHLQHTKPLQSRLGFVRLCKFYYSSLHCFSSIVDFSKSYANQGCAIFSILACIVASISLILKIACKSRMFPDLFFF